MATSIADKKRNKQQLTMTVLLMYDDHYDDATNWCCPLLLVQAVSGQLSGVCLMGHLCWRCCHSSLVALALRCPTTVCRSFHLVTLSSNEPNRRRNTKRIHLRSRSARFRTRTTEDARVPVAWLLAKVEVGAGVGVGYLFSGQRQTASEMERGNEQQTNDPEEITIKKWGRTCINWPLSRWLQVWRNLMMIGLAVARIKFWVGKNARCLCQVLAKALSKRPLLSGGFSTKIQWITRKKRKTR